MARTITEGVRVWFWQRDDPKVPYEIQQQSAEWVVAGPATLYPNPAWGTPDAEFPVGDWCDYNSHFDAHMMVFDLTFCVRTLRSLSFNVANTAFYREIGLAQTIHRRAAPGTVWIVSVYSYLLPSFGTQMTGSRRR